MRTNLSVQEGKSEKILELRKKGYSYDQIRKETGYGKGSISYNLGEGQKEKNLERLRRQNKGFKRKIWGFIYPSRKPKKPFVYKFAELRKKGRPKKHLTNNSSYAAMGKKGGRPKLYG